MERLSKHGYREVKNYIHNELKLTKEDIKEIIIPIVKEEVKRIFHNTYGNDVDVERWIRCMVSDEIQRHGDYSMLRNLCREAIKEEISNVLSIDISIKKKEGENMQNEIFWNENTRYEIYNPYKEHITTGATVSELIEHFKV